MVLEMETEIKRYRTELEDKVGKMEFRNMALEKELSEYKRNCDEMKEKVTRVDEDHRVIIERERRAQERIHVLSEELETMERERAKFKVQRMTEVRDLECGKKRAEEEVEVWKKKFGELETRIRLLEEEATFLRCIEDHFCGKLPDESGGLQDEAGVKKDRNKASTNLPQDNSGFNGSGVGQLRINENLLNANENVHTSDIAGFDTRFRFENSRGKHIAGLPSIDMQCKPLVDLKKEMNSTPIESDMEHERSTRMHLACELEGSSYRKPSRNLDNLKTSSTGMIYISDSDTEDEKHIAPNHTSNLRDEGMADKEKVVSSRKCLKRPYKDQSRDENSIHEENSLTSIPPRRQVKLVTSESEDEDEIPISNIKIKKSENLEKIADGPSWSPMKLRSQTLASGSEKVEESPSRKRLLSLRQCEKKNSMTEKKCSNDTAYPNNLNMSDQKAGSAHMENYNENVVMKGVSSDSEGGSLGGFIVNGSDSSTDSTDSEDEEDTDLGFSQVIAALRRKNDKKSKWQFEADMLSSFEEYPELCLKAVCVLYRQQTSDEKSAKGCLTYNGRGFSRLDALRGSNLAEFLMDGEKDGDLKKSVEELEMHDLRGVDDCKRLARHYSKQLFTIYQNKEDPFFV